MPRCIAAIALAIGLALPSHIRGAEPVRVVVDSPAQVLHVLRGAERLQTFDDIAIGRNGTTADKRAGDGRTPIGQYRVLAIRESTRFHRFVWLSYPTAVQARRAHARGDLPVAARRAIEHADDGGRPPPQDTVLGGYIGIHGVGAGDPAVHEDFNWTEGCVALTDAQIDALLRHITVGTAVEIR